MKLKFVNYWALKRALIASFILVVCTSQIANAYCHPNIRRSGGPRPSSNF